MKAIVVRAFGGPEVLKLEDVPDLSPGSGQVLIRAKAIGVNPVDTYLRSGTTARRPPLPYTPGSDVAGVIEKVGSGVTAFKAGDRVYTHGVADGHGTYSELVLCPETTAHPLSAARTFQEGAAVGTPYATAWAALFQRAMARPAEWVLVHGGSGGVGVAAIQMARQAGLRIIATAGTEKGLALAREQGAHEVLDHTKAGYLDRVMTLTGGRGADIVLEMLANVNLDRDLDILAPRGRVVVIGNRGRIEIDPRKTMMKNSAVLGLLISNTTPDEYREIHAALAAGLDSGTLRPVIARELPLAEAPAAHTAVMQPGALGKIVLTP